MAKTYAVEAVVLKRSNLGEADRLITFLSRYRGKFTSIAKGVRKVASRRGPNLELFNHVKAYFAVGKNFDVVTEVETIHSFKDVKDNLEKVGYGFYLSEITNEFLGEGQGDNKFFELFLEALTLLEETKDPTSINKILRAFEIKLLDQVGFRPQLTRCVTCEQDLSGENEVLSPDLGGLVHTRCVSNSLFTRPISYNGSKVLRFFQREDWPKIERLIVQKDIDLELEKISRFYLEYLLEKELKSNSFVNQIKIFSK
jgi:DNA repair protein RecO (recombination protein O)